MKKFALGMILFGTICITACGKSNQESDQQKEVKIAVKEDENGETKEVKLDLEK